MFGAGIGFWKQNLPKELQTSSIAISLDLSLEQKSAKTGHLNSHSPQLNFPRVPPMQPQVKVSVVWPCKGIRDNGYAIKGISGAGN